MRAQRWEDIHGPSMSMTSSAVLSNQDYNYGTLPMNPLSVQAPPPVLSPAAAGLPLGTPQSPGMVSPGMVPASPAFYASQEGTPIIAAISPRNNAYPSPKTPQNGAGYFHSTPPSPPPPKFREVVSSPEETEQSTSMDDESFQREVEEEGAFIDKTLPIDEAIALRSQKLKAHPTSTFRGPVSPPGYRPSDLPGHGRMDPPDDEPPSLSRDDIPDDEDYQPSPTSYYTSPSQTAEASSPTSYYPSGGEFSADQTQEEGSEYYSREDEYYDSPEQHGGHPYPQAADGHYYHQEEMNVSPESMHRPEVYRRDPHYESQPHPHYHHEETHPDYVHHGVPGPDYNEAPHRQYRSESHPSYGNEGPPVYHEPAHVGAYHGPGHDEYMGEQVSPEMYRGQGVPEYYRSPEGDDYNNTENEPPMDRFSPGTPPIAMPSPKSEVSRGTGSSDHSQSSAMRTAQDLLRRNRAKRMDA